MGTGVSVSVGLAAPQIASGGTPTLSANTGGISVQSLPPAPPAFTLTPIAGGVEISA